MPSVVFDPAAFVARYPEFAGVAVPTLQSYFNEATIYLNNTDTSKVADLARRAVFLNMITAHIAALSDPNRSGLVGRIDSASEGSVNAHLTYSNSVSGSMAWFIQTRYGADYWAATRPYRTMQYRQSVRR